MRLLSSIVLLSLLLFSCTKDCSEKVIQTIQVLDETNNNDPFYRVYKTKTDYCDCLTEKAKQNNLYNRKVESYRRAVTDYPNSQIWRQLLDNQLNYPTITTCAE